MGISISVERVNKHLGETWALSNLTTHFAENLLHGLIGPDGAGKTTLLRILVGLLKVDSGHIKMQNQGNPTTFDAIRPWVAYMPQQQSLYSDLSISEHLDFFRDLYNIPSHIYRSRREELLQLTRLDQFQDRLAGNLSGGMSKKLGLMCALLQSPSVLLLDEPTNGVDPISRREFWDLLYQLKSQKILMIIATAYMDEAERCDHVHLVDHGAVLAQGDPRQILNEAHVSSFEELFLKLANGPAR